MVTETFDIVIRERGTDAIVQKIRAMGQSAKDATVSVNGLSTALQKLQKSFDGSKIIADLQKIASACTTAQNSMNSLTTTTGKLGNTFNQVNIQINQYTSSVIRATQVNNTYNSSISTVNNSVSTLTSGFGGLARTLGALAGIGLGFTQVMQMSDAYTNLENRMRSVALNGEVANQMMQRTFQIATLTSAPVEAVGTAFARYEKSLIPLGYSTQQVGDVTQTVASALKLAGATAGETGSVLKQLSQSFQKGKLDGDEFNSLSENFSGFGAALAKALNIAPFGNFMGQIYELKREGKLTTEIVVKAILGMRESIDQQMGALEGTFGGAMENLRTSAIKFFGELNNSTGIFDNLNSSINYVAQNLTRFGEVGKSVMLGLAVTLIPFAVKAVISLTTAVLGLTAAMLTNPITAVAVALGALVVVLAQTASGMDFLRTTGTIAFNAIYDVGVAAANGLMLAWNGVISGISYAFSIFSEKMGKEIAQLKTDKYLAMRSLTEGVDGKVPQGDIKIVKGQMDSKTKEYYDVLNKGVETYKALGEHKKADALLTKGLTMNEGAHSEALKIVATQSEINSRITAQNILLEKQKGDAEEESTRRRIANLKKEATQIKNTAVQQKARTQLAEEEYQLSLSQLRGKEGFKGAKNNKEVEALLQPSVQAELRKNAGIKTEQSLADETSRLNLGAAIKAQNAKPKAPKKTPLTEEDYYGFEIKRLNDSVTAMKAYGAEKEALANVQKIEQQLNKKGMKLSGEQRQSIIDLTRTEAERKQVYAEVNKLRDMGIEKEKSFQARIEAVTEAQQLGYITDKQKVEVLKQLAIEQANYNLEVGKGNQQEALAVLDRQALEDVTGEKARFDAKLNARKQYYQEAYGAEVEFNARMDALNANRNNMTEENFNIQALKAKASLNQSNLAQGKGNLKDASFNALFQGIQDYQGVLPELSQNFGAFFNQMSTGLSDSISKILTMQGGWEDMAKVGQQAISQLIAGLIQLGIRYLLVNVLAKELGMSTGMGQQQPQQGQAVSPLPAQVSYGGGEQQNPAMDAQIQQMTKLSEANQKAADSTLSVTQNAQGAVGSITNMAGSMSGALQTNEQYSASLDNLGNVVISQFVTSLAGMVAQWAAVQVAQMIFGQSTTMAVAAEAGAVAAAWAPAAAMASLATLGTNAVPAMTAIALTTGMSMALSAGAGMAGFESGGYTGNMGRKDVAGVVHGQEYVVNAQATRKNRPLLEAMNSGGSVGMSGGGARTPNITINNMGTPQNYAVESVTADEVRLIARDQAEMTVAKRTPKLVSNHIKNPNSEISKALGNSTKTTRRRTG